MNPEIQLCIAQKFQFTVWFLFKKLICDRPPLCLLDEDVKSISELLKWVTPIFWNPFSKHDALRLCGLTKNIYKHQNKKENKNLRGRVDQLETQLRSNNLVIPESTFAEATSASMGEEFLQRHPSRSHTVKAVIECCRNLAWKSQLMISLPDVEYLVLKRLLVL